MPLLQIVRVQAQHRGDDAHGLIAQQFPPTLRGVAPKVRRHRLDGINTFHHRHVRQDTLHLFLLDKALREGINGFPLGDNGYDLLFFMAAAEPGQPRQNARIVFRIRRADQQQEAAVVQLRPGLLIQRRFVAVQLYASIIQGLVRQLQLRGQPVTADTVRQSPRGLRIMSDRKDIEINTIRHRLPPPLFNEAFELLPVWQGPYRRPP